MIALAIFTIALVGCMMAIDTISGTVADLRMEAEARRTLDSHAGKVRGMRPFPNRQPIETGRLANTITIKDDIASVTDEEAQITAASKLYKVRMIASWDTPEGKDSLTNTIYVKGKE